MITKKIEFDFGIITILDNIIIATLNEGIVLDINRNKKILELGQECFKGENYAYISNRVNSYAVDPMVYFESSNVDNLKGIAVVSENEITLKNATEFEQMFYKRSNCFEVFTQMNPAIDWIQTKI